MVSTEQTMTERGMLKLASRINSPDITASAITANGLATGDTVENNESRKESYRKDGQPT